MLTAVPCLNAADPLEAEKILDRMRWAKLDELEAGRQFDFDRVCIFKLKLLILAKYSGRTPDAGGAALDAILKRLNAGTEENNSEVIHS